LDSAVVSVDLSCVVTLTLEWGLVQQNHKAVMVYESYGAGPDLTAGMIFYGGVRHELHQIAGSVLRVVHCIFLWAASQHGVK
jgi:hypothetical protein